MVFFHLLSIGHTEVLNETTENSGHWGKGFFYFPFFLEVSQFNISEVPDATF